MTDKTEASLIPRLLEFLDYAHNDRLYLEWSLLTKELESKPRQNIMSFLNRDYEVDLGWLSIYTVRLITCFKQQQICKEKKLNFQEESLKQEKRKLKKTIQILLKDAKNDFHLQLLKLSAYSHARKYAQTLMISLRDVVDLLQEVDVVKINTDEVCIADLITLSYNDLEEQEYRIKADLKRAQAEEERKSQSEYCGMKYCLDKWIDWLLS